MSLQNASDSQLLDIANVTKAAIDGSLVNFPGVTDADVTALDNAYELFNDKLNAHNLSQATALADTAAKEAARDDDPTGLETVLRKIRNKAKAGGTTPEHMAELGIPGSTGASLPTSVTVPAARIDTSERLRHRIDYFDAAHPDNPRKPRGVTGCQIYCKIDGPPPTSEKECFFVGLDTRSPHLVEHDSENGNKTAHYLLRWQYHDGSLGAFSETASATITA